MKNPNLKTIILLVVIVLTVITVLTFLYLLVSSNSFSQVALMEGIMTTEQYLESQRNNANQFENLGKFIIELAKTVVLVFKEILSIKS